MNICINSKDKKPSFPKVVQGDLIMMENEDLYLVTLNPLSGETERADSLMLVYLLNGNIWNLYTLWGETLSPSNVRLVTDDYCLTRK